VSNKWDFLNLPIQPNDNFDVYWRWIDERSRIFEHRLAGEPLVAAPVGDKFLSTLATYSFCNPFRILHTGSQIVVHLQASNLSPEPVEVFFRTALYRAFNSPDTLQGLIEHLGEVPSWKDYDFSVYSDALGKVEKKIGKLYRGAYMFNDLLVFGGDRNGTATPVFDRLCLA
jgi:5-hmdU DNA kinase-like protein